MDTALFFLYFADVADSVRSISIGVWIVVAAAGIIGAIITLTALFDNGQDQVAAFYARLWPTARKPIAWIGVFLLISILMPTKQFLYIAAGASATAAVAQTETAGKAYSLLNYKLDELLLEYQPKEQTSE